MDQQNHNMPQAIGDAGSAPNHVPATYQNLYHQQQQLRTLWDNMYREIEQIKNIKNINFPLAYIEKIMKSDEDVQMIADEVPVVFACACEMFILELTHRGWTHAEKNKRRTLQKNDIAVAISQKYIFEFLADIISSTDREEE